MQVKKFKLFVHLDLQEVPWFVEMSLIVEMLQDAAMRGKPFGERYSLRGKGKVRCSQDEIPENRNEYEPLLQFPLKCC